MTTVGTSAVLAFWKGLDIDEFSEMIVQMLCWRQPASDSIKGKKRGILEKKRVHTGVTA